MMPLVIVESPFAGDVARNIHYARRCLRDCLARGESPIASHLLLTQPGVLEDDAEQREQGIAAGLAWYRRASRCVVYMDYGESSGMKRGIGVAMRHDVPVHRRNIGVNLSGPVSSEQLLGFEDGSTLRAGYTGEGGEKFRASVSFEATSGTYGAKTGAELIRLMWESIRDLGDAATRKNPKA